MRIHSLKYQSSTTLGCSDIVIRKSEFYVTYLIFVYNILYCMHFSFVDLLMYILHICTITTFPFLCHEVFFWDTLYYKRAIYWDIGSEYQDKLEKLNGEWDDWDTRFDVGKLQSCEGATRKYVERGGRGGELSKMLKILEFLVIV